MKYAIIGFGKIGAAIARSFARRKIDVTIENTRGPKVLETESRKNVHKTCNILQLNGFSEVKPSGSSLDGHHRADTTASC